MSAREEELSVRHDGSHEVESQQLAIRHAGGVMNVAREEGVRATYAKEYEGAIGAG